MKNVIKCLERCLWDLVVKFILDLILLRLYYDIFPATDDQIYLFLNKARNSNPYLKVTSQKVSKIEKKTVLYHLEEEQPKAWPVIEFLNLNLMILLI